MMKLRQIFKSISLRHRFYISWAAVFLFFFFVFVKIGFFFSLWHALIITLSLIFVSLVETHVLVKHFLMKGRKLLYYLLSAVFVVTMAIVFLKVQLVWYDFVQSIIPGIPSQEKDIDMLTSVIVRILIYFCVASISSITYLQRSEQESQQHSHELQIENLDMELRYLRSQINPHFLFNALNNIYSLVYTKDVKAPDTVLKLSEMLRYVMVDCQADMISIEKEMKFIDNYVDFQLMKHEDKRDVIITKDVKNNGYMLPPMIFQPVVENAFKYSRIENDPSGFIHISFIQNDDGLEFVAENTIKGSEESLAHTTSCDGNGIGIKNVEKRLSLLYNDRFSFSTASEDNKYLVRIVIR